MKKLTFALAFVLTGLSAPSALASTGGGSPPPAYTGGAAVVKVFYPADGSTVTITATGAVIKQSPGHTAYREGWINTSDICGISAAGDLAGKLRPGSTNPYGSVRATTSCNGASVRTTETTPTVDSSTNDVSTTDVVTAGSRTTTRQPANETTPQSSESQTSESTQTNTSSGKMTALPNTGPGAVVSVFGATTVLGTISHYLFTRRKLLN